MKYMDKTDLFRNIVNAFVKQFDREEIEAMKGVDPYEWEKIIDMALKLLSFRQHRKKI